jgi:cell division protein FtsZ
MSGKIKLVKKRVIAKKPVKNRKVLVKPNLPAGRQAKVAKRILKGPSQSRPKARLVGKGKKPFVKKIRAVRKIVRKEKKYPVKAKGILTGSPQSRHKASLSGKHDKITPRVLKKNKRAAQKAVVEEFPAEALFRARIKVVGIGGGGGSIVSEIGRSLNKATFVIADTDIRALKKRPGIKYFWFGDEFTHGLGTGVNVDLAKQAAESVREKIGDIFRDQDIVIFVASLGGGLGSGATQIFAEEAKKFGGITLGIFTLPFKFEGKNKSRVALSALKTLKQSLNVSLTIPNEKIFRIIDESTPITNAFSVVNKSLIESLESLIDLIYSPGIINIDFADLRTILRGTGNSAFLNTIEESGKNRAEKICERVFINPLLQTGGFEVKKILFNIAGSENLSMFEVEKVSSHISKAHSDAKIIFGISKNLKLKNKIKTTILMTGGGSREEAFSWKPEIILPGKNRVVVTKAETPSIKSAVKPEAKKTKKIARIRKEEGRTPKKPIAPKDKEKKAIPAPEIKPREPVVATTISKKMNVKETAPELIKETPEFKKTPIRRSGLEIKKAEEQEEKKRIDQEKEWEIPAFLRRVKFNK